MTPKTSAPFPSLIPKVSLTFPTVCCSRGSMKWALNLLCVSEFGILFSSRRPHFLINKAVACSSIVRSGFFLLAIRALFLEAGVSFLLCWRLLSVFLTAFPLATIEGGYLEGNKGLSNWDVFTHKQGTIKDGSNGDSADDHYHRYMEDINLMHSLGVNSYRFSIAWTRILPRGRFGKVNPDGVAFYNAIIDALLQKGMQPFVTIYHFDIPHELDKRYGGWLSSEIQKDFGYFADICFKMFGDRVKFWITINEPNLFTKLSYMYGRYAPGHCSKPFGNCAFGNSSVETYIVGHNIILSHANAVHIYRKKYQVKQGGHIGINVCSRWYEPFHNTTADILAVERVLSFNGPWFLDPLILGEYPLEMRKILGSNLPEFTSKQKKKLQATKLDFIGLNHYTTSYLKDCIFSPCELDPVEGEAQVLTSAERDGIFIGKRTGSPIFYSVPYGMEKLVMYYKQRYNNTPIYITENGYAQASNSSMITKDFTNDTGRVDYLQGYLTFLASAIRKGADVRGYFVWSLLDNFEWNSGYTQRFGLYHVDFKTQKRTPKLSAKWYREFLKGSPLRTSLRNGYSHQYTAQSMDHFSSED